MNDRLLFGARTARLVEAAVDAHDLDLRGLSVLTEAATGPFAVTAPLAAVAGAHVEATAVDSAHGSAEESIGDTRRMAKAVGGGERIAFTTPKEARWRDADLITNLGPLRPFTRRRVRRLRRGAAIALMYDARELREDEMDLSACRERGVHVVGVDEEAVDVLPYAGILAVRLLLEGHVEIHRSRIVLLGQGLLARPIRQVLESLGARVRTVGCWDELVAGQPVDAVLYVDQDGSVPAPELDLRGGSDPLCIQYVGGAPVSRLEEAGWTVLPPEPIPTGSMWRTFGALGPRPVVELHAAALAAAASAIEPSGGPRLPSFAQSVGAPV